MTKLFFLIGLLTVSVYANMTPKVYYALEVKAQELTIEGQKERLECMQNSCPISQQYKIDGEYQSKIFEIYQEQGTTPSKVAAYYTRNYKKVDAYLQEDQALKNKLDSLTQTYEDISQEIRALVEEKQ